MLLLHTEVQSLSEELAYSPWACILGWLTIAICNFSFSWQKKKNKKTKATEKCCDAEFEKNHYCGCDSFNRTIRRIKLVLSFLITTYFQQSLWSQSKYDFRKIIHNFKKAYTQPNKLKTNDYNMHSNLLLDSHRKKK